MLTIDRIIAFGWPGADCNTDNGAITRWGGGNPWPQPTPEEIEAKRSDAEVWWRRKRMAVTPLQFRLALDAAGLLDECEAVVAAAPRAVQLSWEYAVTIERLNPFIDQFAAVINKTPEEVDAIFEAAAQIGG